MKTHTNAKNTIEEIQLREIGGGEQHHNIYILISVFLIFYNFRKLFYKLFVTSSRYIKIMT